MTYNLISKSGFLSGVKYVEGTREEIAEALQYEINYRSMLFLKSCLVCHVHKTSENPKVQKVIYRPKGGIK